MVSPILQFAAQGYLRELSRPAAFAPAAPAAPEPFSFDVSARDPVVDATLTAGRIAGGGLAEPARLFRRPLDVDVVGEGYFHLKDPASEQSFYTRSGSFTVSRDGRLVSLEGGLELQPTIRVPQDARQVQIAADGSVRAVDGQGRALALGQIELTKFSGAAQLRDAGLSVQIDRGAGMRERGAPGATGFGALSPASTSIAPASNLSDDPVRAQVTRFAARVRFVPSADLPRSLALNTFR